MWMDAIRQALGGRTEAVQCVVVVDPSTGEPASAGGVSDTTSVLLAFKGYGEVPITDTNENSIALLPDNDGAISIRATKDAQFLLGDDTADASAGGHYIAAGERLDLRVGTATHIAACGSASQAGTVFISGLGRPSAAA